MSALETLRNELHSLADPARAQSAQRFFKTAPGEYAEGDRFLGVPVPAQRKLVARFAKQVTLDEAATLLRSPLHEERHVAVLLFVAHVRRADEATRRRVLEAYLVAAREGCVNNWDLVDASAEHVVGPWLSSDDPRIARLSCSESVWERRIAMIATLHEIKRARPEAALRVATALLRDPYDLIHKAVGWMLREVGERCSLDVEEAFLVKHADAMPRTMLRYAIEKFPEAKRRAYLARGRSGGRA